MIIMSWGRATTPASARISHNYCRVRQALLGRVSAALGSRIGENVDYFSQNDIGVTSEVAHESVIFPAFVVRSCRVAEKFIRCTSGAKRPDQGVNHERSPMVAQI